MNLRPASRVRAVPKSLEAVSGRMRRTGRASSMVSAVDEVAAAASAATEGVVVSSLGDRLRADFPILDQVSPRGRGGMRGVYLVVCLRGDRVCVCSSSCHRLLPPHVQQQCAIVLIG